MKRNMNRNTLSMLKLISIFLITTSTTQACAAQSQKLSTIKPGQLTVCTYPGFAPLSFVGKNGELAGIDIQYLKAFAKSQGLKFAPVKQSVFDNIWTLPGEGLCDIAADGISIIKKRSDQIKGKATYSDPYLTAYLSLIAAKGAKLDSIKDLAGKTVIVTKGTTDEQDLRNRLKKAGIKNTKIIYTSSYRDGVKKVLAANPKDPNSPFAFASDNIGNAYILNSNPQFKQKLGLKWVHPFMDANGKVSAEKYGYIARDASTGLLQALNKYISTHKAI